MEVGYFHQSAAVGIHRGEAQGRSRDTLRFALVADRPGESGGIFGRLLPVTASAGSRFSCDLSAEHALPAHQLQLSGGPPGTTSIGVGKKCSAS